MSVLVKDMEMPNHCSECGVEWCERWKGLIIAGMSIAKSRPSNCPLIEVPTPHGRLIDADALNHEYYKSPSYLNLCKAINDAPTVIEAEEVKE